MANVFDTITQNLNENHNVAFKELREQYEITEFDICAFESNENERARKMSKNLQGAAKPVKSRLSSDNFSRFATFVKQSCKKAEPKVLAPSPRPKGPPLSTPVKAARQVDVASVALRVESMATPRKRLDVGGGIYSPMVKNTPGSSKKAFADREMKNYCKQTPLGADLEMVADPATKLECRVMTAVAPYRFLNAAADRAAAVGARVTQLEDQLGALLREQEGDVPILPVGRLCQTACIIVGRVCAESEGRINERSIQLEGSREISHGQRVIFNTADCPEVRLFPGQIIAAVGMTGAHGAEFFARKIITGLPMGPAAVPRALMDSAARNYAGGATSLVVAAGPYSTADTLDYQPLQELCAQVKAQGAHALVLMGPLLDANNVLVKAGDLELDGEALSYADVYTDIVFPILLELVTSMPQLQVFYVPSTAEMLHLSPLPQPPLNLQAPGLAANPNFHFCSNPVTLQLNELTCLVTSEDAVSAVSSELILRPEMNRVEAALKMLAQQRHLFPVFPYSHRVEPKRHNLMAFEDAHLVISPSKFSGFGRLVEERAFVNPGILCRRDTGTYAHVRMLPPTGDLESLNLAERLRVDIIKL